MAETKATAVRRFLGATDDLGDPAVVERHYRHLESRRIDSPAALEQWLLDWSELDACTDEEGSVRYVQMTCRTEDTDIERRYIDFIENVEPVTKTWSDRLERKLLASEALDSLPADRFSVLIRQVRNNVELFREENVPLQTEDDKLRQQYQKLVGGLTVQHDGREQTLQQMARLLERPERETRREAWEKISARWAAVRDEIEELYDKMTTVRGRIAANAGFENYRDFAFRELGRFDYGPADCTRFAQSIERIVVPAARGLGETRRKQLGIESLRPWDMAVDPLGREPLTPFEDTAKLTGGCARILSRVHPEFGARFEQMSAAGLLDLESRKGKAPGGYMMDYKARRVPFIFMNAVGTHDDVQTLLHEAGHAMHVFAAADEPIAALRDPPIEFAEVASMGMELVAGPFLDAFYNADEAARAWKEHVDGIVRFFPYMAMIDQFQDWVYTHPGHDRGARKTAWQALNRRFSDWVDYSDCEEARDYLWHRKGHPFTVPFYYVEYGIAQLGALGVWLNSRRDYAGAIQAYRRGLALGGRRPLPELFLAAGVRLDFSAGAIEPLIAAAMEEIA